MVSILHLDNYVNKGESDLDDDNRGDAADVPEEGNLDIFFSRCS
jgi:hypothetical protein